MNHRFDLIPKGIQTTPGNRWPRSGIDARWADTHLHGKQIGPGVGIRRRIPVQKLCSLGVMSTLPRVDAKVGEGVDSPDAPILKRPCK